MKNQTTILLAEDEDTDAYFVEWAIKELGLGCQLSRVIDGQQAIDYLSGATPYADRARHPLPAAVLLDLKMPRVDGFDVLAWRGKSDGFKSIPFIVLTSSQHPRDREKALELGAEDYLVKPGNPRVLTTMLREISTRWFAHEPGA